MGKRKDKIEQKYQEYTMKFAGKSKEEMDSSIENLTNQIEEKNNVLKKTKDKDEKEKLEAIIKKLEQEKDNMSGYNKNKDKIEKIRQYKAKLNEKIEPLKQEKAALEETLEEYIKNNKDELELINKTLNDSKVTENMDNEEYNDLLQAKEEIEKGKQEIQKKIDAVQNKIDALARGVSKCDLAWRSLFNDKSWDEIHVRAMNTNYTRKKKDTKTKENPTSKKEEGTKENPTPKEEGIKANTEPKSPNSKEDTTKENSIATVSKFAKKHPILAKMGNWIKNGFKKVGDFFKDEPLDSEQSNKEDKVETKQEIKGERDAFIEELRRHVENDKGDKEAAYIEKHKPKVKTQEEAERD